MSRWILKMIAKNRLVIEAIEASNNVNIQSVSLYFSDGSTVKFEYENGIDIEKLSRIVNLFDLEIQSKAAKNE